MRTATLALAMAMGWTAALAGEPIQVYPTGGSDYAVAQDGRTILTLHLACWGPGWKYFGFRGDVTVDAKGLRTVEDTTKIGGTQRDITLRHTARQTAPDRIAFAYEFRAPQDAELTQICLSVRPSQALFGGSQSTAHGPGGATKPIKVPIGRGTLGGTFDRLVFRPRDGKETVLTIDPARAVSSDGEARITLVPSAIGAGKVLRTSFVLTLPGPARFFARAEDSYQRDDTSTWFPYDVAKHGTPIDLSFLNKDEKGGTIAAGKHGFLTVTGDEFAFEDGTPVRFWGLNVTAGAALGTPERAEQIAERIARLGCNVVRLHHLDSWANPVIDYDHPDGTTQHLSESGMKALDATVAALKKHGIYVILDPWVQRCFKEADGVADYGSLGKRGNFNLHPYVYFDPRMRELIMKQEEQVWTHVNERTGLAYKDDPACILTECINEGLMQRGGNHVTAEPYREQFIKLYQTWAKANGVNPDIGDRIISQNYGKDNLRFNVHVHRDFYRAMHKHFRDIGLRIPVNATNWALWTWEILPQADLDFMDAHHYYGGDQVGPGSGMGGLWAHHPPDVPGQPFGKMGRMAVAGKPLTVSECGNNPPKTYRSAYPIGLAAVAALQGWDSVTGYAFSQGGRPGGKLGPFEWESDPVTMAATAIGSLLLRRGDVRQAKQTVAFTIPEDYKWELHWQEGGR
ncbi:cellulase family glycosylhydrolase, partial [Planctomycetota bacterium]